MSIRKVSMIFMGGMVVLAVVFGLLIFSMKSTMDDVVQMSLQKETAAELGQEMRASSDELTRYARLYARTGDKRFRDVYDAIVDIYAGKIDRPQGYGPHYWAILGESAEQRERPSDAVR